MTNAAAPTGVDMSGIASIFPALAAANAAATAQAEAPAPKQREKNAEVWINFGRVKNIKNGATGELQPVFLTLFGFALDEEACSRTAPKGSGTFKKKLTELENQERAGWLKLGLTLDPGTDRIICADPTTMLMAQIRRVGAEPVLVTEEDQDDFVPSFSTVGQTVEA